MYFFFVFHSVTKSIMPMSSTLFSGLLLYHLKVLSMVIKHSLFYVYFFSITTCYFDHHFNSLELLLYLNKTTITKNNDHNNNNSSIFSLEGHAVCLPFIIKAFNSFLQLFFAHFYFTFHDTCFLCPHFHQLTVF